ncbi:MAG TPA: hypothetical protein VK438_08420 [Xanthobacteraceae bacterium]|nr:hypothetical protein [Xanthobacteraceae bacterium]
MTRHYDPNQPRVPAGHHEGGRWTGGGSASESILNSPLLDQDRLIKAALGIRGRDKQAGTVQLALQGAPVSVQSSFALPRTSPFNPRQAIKTSGLTGLLTLGFLLFSASSLNNGEDGQAIIALKSRDFRRRGSRGSIEFEQVAFIEDPKELEKTCKRFYNVQELANAAYDKAKEEAERNGNELTPQGLGTAAHTLLSAAIEKGDHLKSEVSYVKIDDDIVPLDPKKEADIQSKPGYGQQGTIRPDCEEWPDRKTVCLYDLKTGRKKLEYKRILDFVRSAFHADPCLERAIVTEVRPHDPAVQLPSNK